MYKAYSEYLYIINLCDHIKKMCEMLWMATMRLLRMNESKLILKQSEIIQHTQNIQKPKHTLKHACTPTHTHTCTCAPY